MTDANTDVVKPDSPTLPKDLESRVASLELILRRGKMLLWAFGAVFGLAGIDAFATKVLKKATQEYLSVTPLEEVAKLVKRDDFSNLVWTQMADQVATSYGWSFSLGTGKASHANDPTMRRYMTMPFFGPADLKGVVICYTIQHTGPSAKPTGIEVRLDETGDKTMIIAAAPENESGLRRQHDCITDLADRFGKGSASTGAMEHQVAFAMQDKNAVEDRKELRVLINVVGRLQSGGGH